MPAGDVDAGEQDVAELADERRQRLALGLRLGPVAQLGPKLGQLALEIAERVAGGGVLEADGSGAPLDLARFEQSRQGGRHVVEDALAALALDLDALPAVARVAGGLGALRAEHPGVANAQLGGHAERDVLPRSDLGLLAEQRQEGRLEEQVAELVDQLRREAGLPHGIGDLVGLLDRVRHDRRGRLGAIPGAFAAQHRRQVEQRSRSRLCRLTGEQRALGHRRGSRLRTRQRIGGCVGRAGRRSSAVEGDAECLEALPEGVREIVGRRAACRAQGLQRRCRHQLGLARAECHDQSDRRRRAAGHCDVVWSAGA